MVGVRWIAEGMAESFAYRSLIADGLIPAANLDTFTKRQLTTATNHVTLQSLEASFPGNANPFAMSYLAVDRLLAQKGLPAIRDWCARVGGGQVKFMRAILIGMVVIKLTAIALNGGLP